MNILKKQKMQNLSCKICFEPFDHSKRKPHVLIYCTHTFCHDCVIKLRHNQSGFKCPTCNTSIEDINPNWALLDSIQESSYDQLKNSLQKEVTELESLRVEFKSSREVDVKENSQKMKLIRTDVKLRASQSIKLIHQVKFLFIRRYRFKI